MFLLPSAAQLIGKEQRAGERTAKIPDGNTVCG